MQAGDLDQRVQFLKPIERPRTATGGSADGWEPIFALWANIKYLRGGEAVHASRMQGKRPAIITIRDNQYSRQIQLRWLIEIGTVTYHVRELPKEISKSGFVELLVEAKI
jgi:SPP1 family predicted phage head-tail adaptor